MARAGHAVGLSFDDLGSGKFRLRWRQWEKREDGSKKRVQRTVTAYSVEERKRLEAEIEEALRTRGYWEKPTEDIGARPVDINIEFAAVAWIEWKVAIRGVSGSTRGNLARAMKRFFTELRKVLRLKERDVVHGSMLTQGNITKVVTRFRRRYGEGTIYQTVSAVVDMWTWVASQEKYDSVPRPPYNKHLVLPTPPVYEAPPVVPTMEECDACIRQIRMPLPRMLAVVMRYTGLRLEQAAHVHREDLDGPGSTLLIRKGKSRREKAMMRRVPVSPFLACDLAALLAERVSGPLFPDRRDPSVPIRTYRNQTRYVTEAWQKATANGGARLEAWNPPNRRKARPDHAFRAAFQAKLADEGVADNVIDWLVGHAPRTTRARHYSRPSELVLVRAIEHVPRIDWQSEGTNVLQMLRR